jgi:glycosyltransferase involved in cell wall biosynthesis
LLWRAGLWSRRLFHRRLAAGRYDVVLLTAWDYNTDFLPYAHGTPFLMICHDTIRVSPIPGGAIDASSDPLHRLLYLARRAARVVCVSEATRRDLLFSVPIPDERVAVVRTANILPLFTDVGATVPGLPDRYFLFVGSRQVRKNFDGTVRALAPLLGRVDGPRLVATGRLNVWEQDFVEALGLRDRVLGIEADDAKLVTLYQRAIGLLYPSFYEGFGLPVVEAMAPGCPVVTSPRSALSETAGDAALFVDPADRTALLQAAERLAAEPALRDRLIEAGRQHAGGFQFESMMQAMLEQLRAAAAPTEARSSRV